MELVYIFCNPLLQNIIQVNCLTLYENASVKVISFKNKKIKNDPSLGTICRVGESHTVYVGKGCIVSCVGCNFHVSVWGWVS